MSSILLWKTTLAVFFLLILAYSSSADDDFSSPTVMSSSSDDGLAAGFMNQDFDPLAGITAENTSEEGDCGGANNLQIQPPAGRKRLLRFRKRGDAQPLLCNWQEFKNAPLPVPGTQPGTTDKPSKTGHHGAGTPKVPMKIDSADTEPAGKDRLPDAPVGTPNLELCPGTMSIPVCHYPYLGSVRLNSPVLTLTPCRAWQIDAACVGLEETWCCSSEYPRPQDSLQNINPSISMLYPLTADYCTFMAGAPLPR